MIVAQISDTHIALDTPDAERRLADLARALADINALDPAPDAILHTGDITHGGRREEYALVAAALAKARAPVYVVAGNRDDRANLRRGLAAYARHAPDSDFLDYAVDDHPVRLIVLDTLSLSSNKGDFCAERAERLIALIDAAPAKPVAIFTHHPPFVVTVGPDPVHFASAEGMSRLQQALQHGGRVVGIFSGHVHRSTTGLVGTVPAAVVPAIATTLRKGDYPAHLRDRPVYYLHRFDPACGFVTEARIVEAESGDAAAR